MAGEAEPDLSSFAAHRPRIVFGSAAIALGPRARLGGLRIALWSAATINSSFKCTADLAHPFVAEPSEAFDEDGEGDAFDRVEIDAGPSWDRVVAGVQHNFAG